MNLTVRKALYEEDVTIEIRELEFQNKRVTEKEGKNIAQALWNSLPASTIDAIMAEFRLLEEALKEERGEG